MRAVKKPAPPVTLSLAVVDAFTDQPFTGNPAAVSLLDAFPDDRRLLALAREMNLPETAFVVPRGCGHYDLRWFSPQVEVELCGHATLAAAHVIGGSPRFHTRGGILVCRDAGDGWIEMDFPADHPRPAPMPAALELAGACWYGLGQRDALVELEDASLVRMLEPDLRAVASLGTRALIVTAAGDRGDVDFVSRVFAPNVGIPEDPVTGSAHCTLATFWGRRLGRDVLVGEQASPRGGTVRMRVVGEQVVLAGQAVTVSRVEVLV